MQPSNPFSTQRGKILSLLIAARGSEVPLPPIRAVAAQYNARIKELRNMGYRIPPPRVQMVKGQRHTWYRLVAKHEPATVRERPASPSPAMLRELQSAPTPIPTPTPVRKTESLFGDLAPERHRDDG